MHHVWEIVFREKRGHRCEWPLRRTQRIGLAGLGPSAFVSELAVDLRSTEAISPPLFKPRDRSTLVCTHCKPGPLTNAPPKKGGTHQNDDENELDARSRPPCLGPCNREVYLVKPGSSAIIH